MKIVTVLLFFIIATCLVFGQDYSPEYKNFINRADSLYQLKEYKNSALYYSSAFKTMGWKGSEIDRYNAARTWAMANMPDSAFFCLDRIVRRLGFSNYEKIISEEDFISLHNDKRWPSLIEDVKHNKLPSGWNRWGNKMASYQMYLDSASGQDGKNALTVKSIENKIDGFGSLKQDILSNKYLGKRIRLSGYMKSKDVKGWAGFWLRIDQKTTYRPLAFDNMEDRAIKGTTEWKQYEIVLDVEETAFRISFGALLHGTGQIWFEKLNFEVVDKSVPLTGNLKTEPNLDFYK